MPQIALPYFNLLDEEWIPVVMRDGERKKLGLLELFRQADAVRAVEHPSPLVTAALHRLLLAILYRSLTPKVDSDELADWFVEGWPAEKITGYLEKWRERFFLFHETHPFWQVAEFEAKEKRPWAELAAEHNEGSSKILFDHFTLRSNRRACPADIACWLAAAQTFAIGKREGQLSYSSSNAPAVASLLAFSIGRTLRETLLLNFPYQKRDTTEKDLPVWEREPDTIALLKTKPSRNARGRADLYTWRSRTVRLYYDDDRMVSRIGFASGVGYENMDTFPDPHAALAEHEKNGLFPMKLKQRGLWRDFDSLLPNRQQGNKSRAPQVIDHAIALCAELEERGQCPSGLSVMICGQVNDNAKIECWRMERFILPTAILDKSNDVRETIKLLLGMAEKWQSQLDKACKTFATEYIRRDGDRKLAAEDIKKIVEQMPCTAVYWNHLEYAFKQNLEHGFTDPEQAQKLWRGKIRDALALAWKAQTDSVGDGDAWTIRAMTKAGGIVGNALKELTELLKGKQDAVGKEE